MIMNTETYIKAVHNLTEILKNENYEDILSNPPYNITIKKYKKYAIFNYNLINSTMSNPIVRVCRGIIYDMDNVKPVCVPFFKFDNYNPELDSNALDMNSLTTQEKVDGSIMKLWFDNDSCNISTNGTINARYTYINKEKTKTFGDLFIEAFLDDNNVDLNSLNKNHTYIFELCSPETTVVVPHTKLDLYHIGTRDNTTLKELDIDIGIKKPKVYNLSSLDECIDASKHLPFSNEGYVVVDKDYNRVKIKSPSYVMVSHVRCHPTIKMDTLVPIVLSNEIEEFLTYFPEYTSYVKTIQNGVDNLIEVITNTIDYYEKNRDGFKTRKDFALYVTKKPLCAYLFKYYINNDIINIREFIMNIDSKKLLKEMCIENIELPKSTFFK